MLPLLTCEKLRQAIIIQPQPLFNHIANILDKVFNFCECVLTVAQAVMVRRKGKSADHAGRGSDKRAGRPRLDQRERLRHRFYEPLCMLWILNPSTGHGFTESPYLAIQAHDGRHVGQWRSFLDALSWFGDHKHGGASVSAVAAEMKETGVNYWICGRFEASAANICRVLAECALVSQHEDDGIFPATLQRVIATGIWFSRERVKSYQKDLSTHLRHAIGTTSHAGQMSPLPHVADGFEEIAARMHITLLRLVSDVSDRVDICSTAHDLASSQDLKRLCTAAGNAYQTTQWTKVRHVVTRLGSWHRKAATALRFTRRNPQLFTECSSTFLQLPEAQRLPLPDGQTNVRGALTRMLPAGSKDRVEDLYERLQSCRVLEFDQQLLELYSDQDTRLVVHAEAFLLDHFYSQELPYVWHDKYVGCSKPSCYCCHLYQRFHPDNPVLRPAHGTAWHRWAAPTVISDTMEEKTWRHHRSITNKMNEHIRRDVLADISARMPRRDRERDSTSRVTTDI